MAQGQLTEVFRKLRRLIGSSAVADLGDGELLERFRKERDETAFAGLLERHGQLVLNVCRRMLGNDHDADDAFQATFLVLARKADTIRRGQSVSSWLHGVACRVSMKAKTRAARLRLQERQASMRPTSESTTTPTWDDLRPVLDEELSKLPEKYRLPVVKRYFEGKSHEETARELGWPSGSVSWRLSRALDMLRQRLARRGVTMPAAGLTSLLVEHAQAHAVTPALADNTFQAAMQFLAGGSAGTPASLELAQGVIQAMWHSRMKWLTVSAFVLLIGVGAASYLGWQLSATAFVPAEVNAPEETPEQVAARIRKLLPEAASSSVQELRDFAGPRGMPMLADAKNQTLTVISMFTTDKDPDIELKTTSPARIAAAISASEKLGYGSLLQPGNIKEVTCNLERGAARGTVSFDEPGVYAGKIDFSARRLKTGWRIEQFRLPKGGVATSRQPDGAWAINEFAHLELSLDADRTQTSMNDKEARPVRLEFRFRNTGDKPITLNTHQLFERLLRIEVQGPEGGYELIKLPELDRRLVRPPAKSDFPVIEPGKIFTHSVPFPGQAPDQWRLWHVSKPGAYRIQARYLENKFVDNAFAKEYWKGGLRSNVLTLNVVDEDKKPAIRPAPTLDLTIKPNKTITWLMADGKNANPVNLELTFRNIGKEVIHVPIPKSTDGFQYHYLEAKLTGPSGLVDGVRMPRLAIPTSAARDEFHVLKPGASFKTPITLNFPNGPFGDRLYSITKPGVYSFELTYKNNYAGVMKDWWLGSVTSNKLGIQVTPSVADLFKDLEDKDGAKRLAASQTLFKLGKDALPEMKLEGGKQISVDGTISSKRRDMIYSLIEGLVPTPPKALAGYRNDSFGIVVDPGVAQADLEALGKKHGFTLQGKFDPEVFPNCYVKLKGNATSEHARPAPASAAMLPSWIAGLASPRA